MNFGEIKDMVHYGLNDEDALLGVIPKSVNAALRDIQARHSWATMKARLNLTLTAGSTTVDLGADFKELQGGHTPVQIEGDYPRNIRVFPSAEAIRRNDVGGWPYQAVFLPLSDSYAWVDGTTLSFPQAPEVDLDVSVAVVQYVPALVEDNDENYFTVNHPNAVVNLTKFKVGGFSPNPNTTKNLGGWFQTYDQEIQQAIREDAHKQVAGKTYRMGG